MPSTGLSNFLAAGDCLIIVPPFAGNDRASLAPHLLQACAKKQGDIVRVLYANVMLAAQIGEQLYEMLCYGATGDLVGERLFARAAYGVKPMGADWSETSKLSNESQEQFSRWQLDRLEAWCYDWVNELAGQVTDLGFPVVGCTTTFEQTSASVAILSRVKSYRAETITIMGGANCDGELAEGIKSLGGCVDSVFSGESEATFPRFMASVRAGRPDIRRIIRGEPLIEMDRLPVPDFSEFYQQYGRWLPAGRLIDPGEVWLPYETSRGCWWGEKHHCTFCGINGSTMKFREKSPDRVLEDLRSLTTRHKSKRVVMYDNIMPHSYFESLLPRLSRELPGLRIFYEQKSNLSLDRVQMLSRAGVVEIQPGIEALSTSLLRRMCKGVSASQNVALLRYARSLDMAVRWNLLYSFPGDQLLEYESTLKLLPLLRHLEPPCGLFHLSIDRFSPYFDRPDQYGITNIRPMEAYWAVLPARADVPKAAYHFIGDYEAESRSRPEVIMQVEDEVKAWQASWKGDVGYLPMLAVAAVAENAYLMLDTRDLPGTEVFNFIDEATARVVLAGHRGERIWAAERALVHQAAVELDGRIVPLATASPDLIAHFEVREKAQAKGAGQIAAVALEMV
jgi:ribosomal peptide maturation radical SAM protein 1